MRHSTVRVAIDRRTLLRQFGPAAAFLLPLLRERVALAAGAARRLVVFHIPNGVHGPQFWPAAGGYDFAGRILEPLTPVKAKTSVVRGVSFAALVDHEGLPKLFTNQKVIDENSMQGKVAGPSIDWGVADHLQAGPHKTPIHSVQIGIDCYNSTSRLCAVTYNKGGSRQAAETNPKVVFDRLFASIDAACRSGGTPAAALTIDEQRRRSILDALRGDLRSASVRLGLGASERLKLDRYESALRDIELELNALQTVAADGCRVADPKARVAELQARLANQNMAERGRLVADMLVLAFLLGRTNVASVSHFQEGARGPETELRWFRYRDYKYAADGKTSAYAHHPLSHWAHKDDPEGAGKDSDSLQILFAVDRWCMETLSHLAQKLDAEKTAAGTMLDETVLLYLGAFSDGDRHNSGNVPCVLVGGKAGGLPQGKMVDARVAHGQILTAAANACGMQLTSFGNDKSSTPASLR